MRGGVEGRENKYEKLLVQCLMRDNATICFRTVEVKTKFYIPKVTQSER